MLSLYRFDDLNEIQAYGLLSKWAIAVLARNSLTKVNFELTEPQIKRINRLFEGKLKVPETKATNDPELTTIVEEYAKKIIQFSPY
jgi:hypothetical protein